MFKLCTFFIGIVLGSFPLALSVTNGSIQRQDAKLAEEIDRLIGVFADPQARGEKIEQTRSATARLAAIGAPAVPQIVTAILGKNNTVQAYSGVALDEIGKEALPYVRNRWQQLDVSQRWKLMNFLGKNDYAFVADFAVESLRSPNPEVRRQAIPFVGKHAEMKARGVLLEMLNTEDYASNRWLVVESLTVMGNDDVAGALMGLLGKDSWAAKGIGLVKEGLFWPTEGRDHIIRALAKMGAKKAAPKLLEVLQEKGPGKGYLGHEVMPVLAKWGYKNCIPELKIVLESATEVHAAFTAACLLELGDRSGLPAISQQLKSDNPDQRLEACLALARHGSNLDVPLLATCLDDPIEDLRACACRGLERITGVMIRSPGQVDFTLDVLPLWKLWWESNKTKYGLKKRFE